MLITACGGDDDAASATSEVTDDRVPETTIAATTTVDATAPPPTPTPDVAWTLDGDGTPDLGDASLEFVGAHALGDEAVSFDGYTGHAITSAPGPIDTTQSFTVTAWVNYAAPSEIAAAVSQLADVTGAYQLGIGETSQWWFMMKTKDQTGLEHATWAEGAATGPSNQWFHLAGVHDHEAGMIRLYVDGELAGETPFSTPVAAAGPMTIGRSQFDSVPGNFWPGAVADVAAYRSALTASQIAELHAATTPANPPPAQPDPDSSTYADGILNGTWDYLIPDDSDLRDFIIRDFGLTDPRELRIRAGFDDHEWWQGVVVDGELILEPGGVPAGSGGTYVIVGEELIMSDQPWKTSYRWQLDGDQLDLTILAECNNEVDPPRCADTREEIIEMDPFVIEVSEHTYTKSSDDPSY